MSIKKFILFDLHIISSFFSFLLSLFVFHFLLAVHHPPSGSSINASTTGFSRFAFIGFASASCSQPITEINRKCERVKKYQKI